MNKWKIIFLIVVIFSLSYNVVQQFRIMELEYRNEHLSDIMIRINSDLESIRKSILVSQKKGKILEQFKKNAPDLKLFEYDLGSVKMKALNLDFDKNNNIVSITTQVY